MTLKSNGIHICILLSKLLFYKIWWFRRRRHSLPILIKTMDPAIQIQIFMSSNCNTIETPQENHDVHMRQRLKPYQNNGLDNTNKDVVDFLIFLIFLIVLGSSNLQVRMSWPLAALTFLALRSELPRQIYTPQKTQTKIPNTQTKKAEIGGRSGSPQIRRPLRGRSVLNIHLRSCKLQSISPARLFRRLASTNSNQNTFGTHRSDLFDILSTFFRLQNSLNFGSPPKKTRSKILNNMIA